MSTDHNDRPLVTVTIKDCGEINEGQDLGTYEQGRSGRFSRGGQNFVLKNNTQSAIILGDTTQKLSKTKRIEKSANVPNPKCMIQCDAIRWKQFENGHFS